MDAPCAAPVTGSVPRIPADQLPGVRSAGPPGGYRLHVVIGGAVVLHGADCSGLVVVPHPQLDGAATDLQGIGDGTL